MINSFQPSRQHYLFQVLRLGLRFSKLYLTKNKVYLKNIATNKTSSSLPGKKLFIA